MNDIHSWIGRETRTEAFLDPAQANRMAATLGRERTFRDGDPLPHGWHWLYFHDIVPSGKLGRDGHPALGEVMPPVPLERRMWAAGALRFEQPLLLGQRAERVSRISGITKKKGKSGELYFVEVESEVTSDAHLALHETQTIVYREMDGAATTAQPEAPSNPDFSEHWQLDNVALFRYSALTFNGHRIHFDVDYARLVEGYEDLVIHGPLIATLLLDLAAQNSTDLATFEYRAKSPLLLPDPFTVYGKSNDSGLHLWAATLGGRLAMEATATRVASPVDSA